MADQAYFILQYKMLNRRFRDAGFHPLVSWLLLAAGFIGFSIFLFYKTEFAEPIYLACALALTGRLAEHRRNDFLKMCFGNHWKPIRILENLFVVLPFIIFLLLRQNSIAAGSLAILAPLFALAIFRATPNLVLPTPFSRQPFEFAAGFRNTWYLCLAAYALSVIAVIVNNFNLAVFSILLVFAIPLSYYVKPEPEYYVWNFSVSARQFLVKKIKTAFLYSAILALPVGLLPGILFPENIPALALIYIVGWAFLVFTIVSKYAAYPDEMSLFQAVLFGLCISFPPLLLLLIPYLFVKSERRLAGLL